MSPNIKCLTPQEEESFLDILKNRKDAERAYMLYHLMLITGLRLSEALSLNVEHTSRVKVELKVKGWTKKGEKKDRYKAVYFPKALQKHLKDYIRVKAKKTESFAPEAPLFVSR
ncbi:MAG: site-specific integrase, partial [Candidatus Omnitrophica bacterium]|nr:site-specific integrase [Candidatus Omnitrophota bacterium]